MTELRMSCIKRITADCLLMSTPPHSVLLHVVTTLVATETFCRAIISDSTWCSLNTTDSILTQTHKTWDYRYILDWEHLVSSTQNQAGNTLWNPHPVHFLSEVHQEQKTRILRQNGSCQWNSTEKRHEQSDSSGGQLKLTDKSKAINSELLLCISFTAYVLPELINNSQTSELIFVSNSSKFEANMWTGLRPVRFVTSTLRDPFLQPHCVVAHFWRSSSQHCVSSPFWQPYFSTDSMDERHSGALSLSLLAYFQTC